MPMCRTPGHIAERAGFDRIDERAHALPARSREVDLAGRAAAALGDMGRRLVPSLGLTTSPANNASRGAAKPIVRARQELVDDLLVEMRLRPIEIDPGGFEAQAAQPVGLGGEQLVEPLDR